MDRKEYINKRLKEHYNQVVSMGYEVFCIVVQGSQNYNMDIYDPNMYVSDIDTRCIVLPKFESFVLKEEPISFTYEFPDNKEHIDIKEIDVMFSLWKKANIQFLEILFSDFYYVPDKYKSMWEELREKAELIVNEHKCSLLNAISGMAMEKYKALTHPYPTIIDKINKFGYDPKQAHHIFRLHLFINQYIKGGSFKSCLTPKPVKLRNDLIRMKINGFGWDVEKMKYECKMKCDEINNIKNNYINENGKKDIPIYGMDNYLDDIKVNLTKIWFKEYLTK